MNNQPLTGLTPDLTNAFNQITGGKVSATPSAGPSRADEIRALGKSASSPTSQNTSAFSPLPQIAGQVKDIGNEEATTLQTAGADVTKNAKTALGAGAADNKDYGSFGANFGADLAKRLASLGHIAGDVATTTFAPIMHTVAALVPPEIKGDYTKSINWAADKITNNPTILGALNKANDALDANPDLKQALTSDLPGALSLLGANKVSDLNPEITKGSFSDATKGLVDDVKTGTQTAKSVVSQATSNVTDLATAAKDKIAPIEPVDTTVAKAFQGRPTDTEPVKNALSQKVTDPEGNTVSGPLDLSSVKTHAEVVDAANAKLKDIIKIQDAHIDAQDSTPRKMQQLALDEGKVNGKSVVHNYVNDAIDHLKELYEKTNDPVNLQKIKDIAQQLDPIKGKGLTLRQINDLARRYGSEFKDKAFSKVNGDPLTNVNAQSFENTRIGLKNTVRDLLPDDVSKGLDTQYHNITDVRDLSQDMVNKVHDVLKRLQSKNFFQKMGARAGKLGKITGVGDVAKELLGIENTPGASSMNAVELQQKLPSYIRRITQALGEDDQGFVSSIKDMINHPK